ncbi:prolipoprotein diacylglyceryl transferase [Halorientalis marina]|jgi:hypothetical protein|uniref:prolipoprotein diacylglyceryl transferase n=1 Tax=Halorientalis marina TaxID=2931976 RepID=UPI001FF0E7F0|nr:prolipoprotein diacylglyceryl transferase [Halorientalis marina]
MPSDTPPTDGSGSPTDETNDAEPPTDEAASSDATASDSTVFDRETLSDLLVNAVPIGIILAFVLMFGLASPSESGGDPLVLFHAALVAGVVVVSYVAARVISGTGAPLTGSVSPPDDAEESVEDD